MRTNRCTVLYVNKNVNTTITVLIIQVPLGLDSPGV